jgi:carnitine 3-dehydrogenase
VLENARASLPALSDVPLPPEGRLHFAATVAEAAEGADWVQESVPERLDLKHRVIAAIQAANPAVPIGSSTSGFRPSQLQEGAAAPARILVAHPFNPVYLLPLVELVPSPATAPEVLDAARATVEGLGMHPLHVRKEIDAFIADRCSRRSGARRSGW